MRGIYLVQRPCPQHAEIWVEDDAGRRRFMIESDYREAGYQPPVHALPSENEYRAASRSRSFRDMVGPASIV